MPIIRVDLFEGRTRAQKAEAARRFTEIAGEVLGAPPDSVRVLFTDFARSDWSVAGRLMDEET
jgi:4-oxalocrotonate tautomerase